MDHAMQMVDDAFADVPRPEHPIDHPDHCDECREYYELMKSRDRTTLTLEDIRFGQDALIFLNPDAFRYFFPAFARLCVAEYQLPPDDPRDCGFAQFFIGQLATPISKKHPPASHKQARLFDRKQVDAALMFLRYLRETWHNDGAEHKQLDRAIRNWEYFQSRSECSSAQGRGTAETS